MSDTALFWLIPVLPLSAFVVLACGLLRFGTLAAGLAIAALAGAFALALAALVAVASGARAVVTLPWLSTGGRTLDLALALDPLSGVVAALVAGVGLVVFCYAARYMAGDPGYGRFFTEMSLFIGAMLALVLAADLITLFLAWEVVGMCSYLLIGFWHQRPGVPAAATRAFATTRLADLVLLFAVVSLTGLVGTSRISAVLAAATSGRIAGGVLPLLGVLIVIGAAGKSAQIPFQGWLPDAMAGPTPVSALLHSATMVAAGVFLLARLFPLLVVAPGALLLAAWLGALTALLGATVALAQTDLKRLLAYSTLSQIGLMFVGIGSGSVLAGIGLLIAQAIYKSALFLAAGAVDHAVDGTAFDRMGGLARRMPVTAVVFALAAAALAGLPVTLALPAKDAVLAAAQGQPALFILATVASLFTALYSARAFGEVFLGRTSDPARQAHEAPRGLLGPLLVLAVALVVVLLANAALLGQPLARLLLAMTPESPAVTALALGCAVGGVVLGLAARVAWPDRIIWPVVRPSAPVLQEEFGFRPLYLGLARAFIWATGVLGAVDRQVFDAFAGAAAHGVLVLVRLAGRFDLRGIDAAFTGLGRGIADGGQALRRLQTGMIGNELLAVALWGLGIVVLALIALAVR